MVLSVRAWERVGIFGKTQHGKSHLVKALLRGITRYIVYDVKREYKEFGKIVHDLHGLASVWASGCRKVIMQPRDISVEFFESVCDFIWNYCRSMVFVVDELPLFAPLNQEGPAFKRIVTVMQGEEFRVGLWGITQLPQAVSKVFRSQLTVRISFRLADENEAKHVGKIPPDELMNLQKYYFAWYDDAESDYRVCAPLKF